MFLVANLKYVFLVGRRVVAELWLSLVLSDQLDALPLPLPDGLIKGRHKRGLDALS
jgi:hypothetical protein